MNILVTGCNGKIGTLICQILKELDSTVMGIDLKDTNNPFVDEFHKGDYSSSYCEELVREFKPEYFVHCAITNSGKSRNKFVHNSCKLVEFLDVLKDTPVKSILYIGSSSSCETLNTDSINEIYLSSFGEEYHIAHEI